MDRTIIHGREEKQMSITENPEWVRKTKNSRGALKQNPVRTVTAWRWKGRQDGTNEPQPQGLRRKIPF